MTDVDRRNASSIPARTTAARLRSHSRGKARPQLRAGARGRVPGLDTAPKATAGSPSRRKTALPRVDRKSSADTAAREVLAALAAAAWKQQEAIVAGGDGDAVHDLRVAARRARTLLGQLRGVFPQASTKTLRDGLRWLGEISGPLRDLDILAQMVKDARDEMPESDRPALAQLGARLERERDEAQHALLDGFASARHRRLVDAFTRFTTPSRRAPREAAAMPIPVIAAESIERAWKRLLRHGRRIDDASPGEALHQVRIDGKKLRYLLELFRSAYPDLDLGPLIASLKDLQDCLGAINDAAVGESRLRALIGGFDQESDRPRPRGAGDPTATLILVGRLIERASAGAATARRRFPARFDDLRSKENRKLIKALAP